MLIKYAIIIIAFLSGLGAAAAQSQPACPETIEQSLYNLSLQVQAGQEQDAGKIAAWAKETVEKCPDRGTAQALATRLLMVIYPAAASYDDKNTILTLALKGVSQGDYAWRVDAPDVQVQRPDGSMETLYLYRNSSSLLEEQIIPNLFRTAAAGHPAAAFSEPNLAQCPYKSDKQNRAEREAKSLLNHVLSSDFSKAEIAYTRLDALGAVCDQQAGNMLHTKAELTYQVARRELRDAVQMMSGRYTGTEDEALEALSKRVETFKTSQGPMRAYIQYVRSGADDGDKDKSRAFDSRITPMDRWLERYDYYTTCMAERGPLMRSVDPCPDLYEP